MIQGWVGRPEWTWARVAAHLARQPHGTVMRLEPWQVEHPRDGGLRPSVGLPRGQRADWRHPAPHCGGLHVVELVHHYEAHLDRKNPVCDPVGHVVEDVPWLGGGLAVGALVGALVGRSPQAMLVGALAGALLGGALTLEQVAENKAKGPA